MSKESGKKRARRGLRLVRQRAEEIANDATAASEMVDKAYAKARRHAERLDRLRDGFFSLMRMVKARYAGDYDRIPWRTLVMATASILYFLNPMDLIPDFLLGVGLVDDASVIAFTLSALRRDLEAFAIWERDELQSAGRGGGDRAGDDA